MKTFNENAALDLMREGKSLVHMHTRQGHKWYLADGQVSNETAQKLIERPYISQLDAGLFAGFALSYSLHRLSHG